MCEKKLRWSIGISFCKKSDFISFQRKVAQIIKILHFINCWLIDRFIQRPRQRGAAPLQLRRCWLRVRYRYWPRVVRIKKKKKRSSNRTFPWVYTTWIWCHLNKQVTKKRMSLTSCRNSIWFELRDCLKMAIFRSRMGISRLPTIFLPTIFLPIFSSVHHISATTGPSLPKFCMQLHYDIMWTHFSLIFDIYIFFSIFKKRLVFDEQVVN